MNSFKTTKNPLQTCLFLFLIHFTTIAFSQKADSLQAKIKVHGAITITNNGISVIPTFLLGKPATIFDLVVAKNRFSFEPQFRFAIEDAKPWSFIFWLRYKLIQSKKFHMSVGVHPSTVFRNSTAVINGVNQDLITIRRYFASEFSPTYFISKNVSVSVYYLYSRGLADATRNTNFVALGSNISNIKLSENYFMRVVPQVYYLRLDDNEGYYVTSSFTLTKRNLPLSIASIINKKIESAIQSEDFVWNVSLIYAY
jgi:hypothetical protein